MTPTSLVRAHPTSRYRWVPATAGWIVGVIATLSLLASVSPLIRSLIRVPREWVDDYIFNFPDTSFAWAFVLALLAAALAARKRIAWWILVGYMIAAAGWNIADLAEGGERWFQEMGELIGLVFHLAAIAFLLLARKEFWARVRRGALFKAAATLVTSMAVGTLVGWGLLKLFPGLWPGRTGSGTRSTGSARSPAWAPNRSADTPMFSSTRCSDSSARWR